MLRRSPNLDIVRIQDVGLSGADDPTVLEWSKNVNYKPNNFRIYKSNPSSFAAANDLVYWEKNNKNNRTKQQGINRCQEKTNDSGL